MATTPGPLAVRSSDDDSADDLLDLVELRRRIRVLVVDDEEIIHWGFRLMLARQGWVDRCISARDADSAVALAQRSTPDVALVDMGLAEHDGADLYRRIRSVAPQTRMLLLAATEALPAASVRACGAAGYVCRAASARDLVRAIRHASLGLPVGPRPDATTAAADLSARQQEILVRIASGETNAEIAEKLFLSRHTVKHHTSALYRKLGVRNRTHAVETARRLGLMGLG
jgi:two-component system response regulator DesR